MSQLITIILAAGSSSRLGQPKQNLVWKGETLLERTVRISKDLGSTQQFVVLGANKEKIDYPFDDENVILIDNPNWEKGMGESLKEGIRAVKTHGVHFDLVMILLVDMPKLETEDLSLLVENAKTQLRTTATYHDGGPGVPVVFMKEDLLKLDHPSEKGAQSWLSSHQNEIDVMRLPNAAYDVDTKEDWAKLQEKNKL